MKGSKYLSELVDCSMFQKGKLNLIEAPTGCGKKTQIRTNVARGKYGFVGSFDTGTPEIYVSAAASMRL